MKVISEYLKGESILDLETKYEELVEGGLKSMCLRFLAKSTMNKITYQRHKS